MTNRRYGCNKVQRGGANATCASPPPERSIGGSTWRMFPAASPPARRGFCLRLPLQGWQHLRECRARQAGLRIGAVAEACRRPHRCAVLRHVPDKEVKLHIGRRGGGLASNHNMGKAFGCMARQSNDRVRFQALPGWPAKWPTCTPTAELCLCAGTCDSTPGPNMRSKPCQVYRSSEFGCVANAPQLNKSPDECPTNGQSEQDA